MQDIYIDVLLEIPTLDLAAEADPTKAIYDRMREAADAECDKAGATLRTDRAPEVHIRQGRHPLLGLDMTLVASRWAVVAPERVAAAVL